MSNTILQIKYSPSTSAPGAGSLANGEIAYSYNSNKLFIGNTAGTGILTIGGSYYTGVIDAASAANGASTLVLRDAEGIITSKAFAGEIYGNANTATKILSGKRISFSGDANGVTVFDGSANVDIALDLSDTGVTPGVYGSSGNIPQITIDAEGRVSLASNVGIASSSFDIRANTGSGTLVGGETLELRGGDGLTVAVSDVTPGINALFSVDSTVVRTTGNQSIAGDKTFSGETTFSGNATFTGTVTTVNTEEINLADNIIKLNSDISNATAPTQDAGISVNRGSSANVSLYWGETADRWTINNGTNDKYIASNTDVEVVDSKTTSAFAQANAASVTAIAAFAAGNTNATNINTVDTKAISAFAQANASFGLAQVAFGQANVGFNLAQVAYGQANTATTAAAAADVKATSAFGVANTAAANALDASAMNTGTVASARISGSYTGITGLGTVTVGVWNGTIVGVAYGGTGVADPAINSLLIGAGSSAMLSTGAPTEGKILQGAANGRPIFADISCGVF